MKKILLWGLGIIVGLGVLGALFKSEDPKSAGGATGTAVAAKADAPPEALAVDSRTLAQALKDNEIGALEKYGKKALKVTGRLTGVEADFSNNPVLLLAGLNEFQSVRANLPATAKSDAAKLSKGTKVTVICTGGLVEAIGFGRLMDCDFS